MTIVNKMDVTKEDAKLVIALLSNVPWDDVRPEQRRDGINLMAKLSLLPFGGCYKEQARNLLHRMRESGETKLPRVNIAWEEGHRVVWDEHDEHDEGTIVEVRTTRGGLVLCNVRWDVARETTENMHGAKLKPKPCVVCERPLKACPSGEVCENGHGQ